MTPDQRFFFDLTGYLHVDNVLDKDELKWAQEAADRYINTPAAELPPGLAPTWSARISAHRHGQCLASVYPRTSPPIGDRDCSFLAVFSLDRSAKFSKPYEHSHEERARVDIAVVKKRRVVLNLFSVETHDGNEVITKVTRAVGQ